MNEENVKAEILNRDRNLNNDREEEDAPPTFLKNPGIIIDFVKDFETGDKEILCKHSDFKAICSQSGPNELTLKIEFQLKMKGVLEDVKFDPANTANPLGDKIIYVEFDDAAERTFKNRAINPVIKVTEGAASGMAFVMGFPDVGKTRWGR